jgi:hypothetical protein
MNSTQDAKLFSRVIATWNVALRSCRFPQLPAIQLSDQSVRGRYDDVMIADEAQRVPLLEGVLSHIAAVVVEVIPSRTTPSCFATSSRRMRKASGLRCSTAAEPTTA